MWIFILFIKHGPECNMFKYKLLNWYKTCRKLCLKCHQWNSRYRSKILWSILFLTFRIRSYLRDTHTKFLKTWDLFPKIYSTTSEVNQPQNTASYYLIFISRMWVFYLTDSLLKGSPKSSSPFPIQTQACMQVKQTLFTKQKRIKLHFSSFHCSLLCASTFINHRERNSFVSS